jgi:hypothetical protein
MGDDEGKVEWTTLIAVLRAGTVIVDKGGEGDKDDAAVLV